MTGIFILVWGMLCHNPTHIPGKTSCPLTHVMMTSSEGPGDSGNTPPKPPPPPPPPTGPQQGN